ncbi:hypothetical protein [Paraburkholderia dilworthii]|uniref:Uncharacterized protein n=1 Tax=Paraburkholderia dilworthii TaxID=948106 RepID=A0ABW9DCT1_9BURK
MSPSNPQQDPTHTAQSADAAVSSFAASVQSIRTVALSLLVDRALSA